MGYALQTVRKYSVVARRCGIARFTLQRRIRRQGEENPSDRSHRFNRLGRQKFHAEDETLVLKVRDEFKYGKLRISHLFRVHDLKISTSTIATMLKKNSAAPIRRFRKNKPPIRYAKLIPGERVQLDVRKIRAGPYQYTAMDDCTRLRVLKLYERRSASSSIDFFRQTYRRIPSPSATHSDGQRTGVLYSVISAEADGLQHQVSPNM
jgi:hypothetical protein